MSYLLNFSSLLCSILLFFFWCQMITLNTIHLFFLLRFLLFCLILVLIIIDIYLFSTSFLLLFPCLAQSLNLFCLNIQLKLFILSRNYPTNILNNSINFTPPILRIPFILKHNLINISSSILKFLKTSSQ